jgi:hypothetical protein
MPMDGRASFLNRRYRVEIIIGQAFGVLCGALGLGMRLADCGASPMTKSGWFSLTAGGVVTAWLCFALIQRMRWLDSAVPESGDAARASRPTV